ncbi:unnamed protein product [Penicillium roqueforti FM164]|uniref:Uncharacterized protein n=1 Tax=Penicillium roqueforti (strain FM164) TaxID=1365484 RepID=W6QNW0_PENRF|nr:unnamed protein product [Penicillium roqueforti FM164]
MAAYVDPRKPVADSEFSPLEDSRSFHDASSSSPGVATPSPSRCDCLAETPCQCAYEHEYSVHWCKIAQGCFGW